MSSIKNFYFLFFLTIVGWLTLAYFTMEQQIQKQEAYAKLINISGKQRMLSQRSALYSLMSLHDKDKKLISKRDQIIEQLLSDHETILANIPSNNLRKFYFSSPYFLDQSVRQFAAKLRRINSGTAHFYIDDILNDSDALLGKLDAAVSGYQAESEAISRSLQSREILILCGSIITLTVEYLFLFLPILGQLKDNERKLVESKETFEQLVKFAPDGTQIATLNGQLKMYSNLTQELFGYSEEEMKQLHIADLDVALSEDEIADIISRLSHDDILLFETKHRCKDGSVYDALISARLIELNGETMVYSSVKDVTKLNEMKRKTDIDALKLRVAAQSANMGIWQWEPTTDELVWDEKMYEIFGVDHLLSFEKWQDCVVDKDRQRVTSEILNAIELSHAFQSQYCITLPNGRRRCIQASAKPVLSDDGNLQLLVGTTRDITSEQENLNKLSSLNLQLSQAQTLAKLGHWEFNHLTQELSWSDEVFSIFLLDREQTTPTTELYLSTIHPDDRQVFNLAYEKSLINQQPYDIIHRLVLGDDRIKYVHEIGQSYFDEKGRPLRTMGTVQDITEQRLDEIKSKQYIELIDRHIITSRTDLQGVITDVSSAFCHVSGYTKQELIGGKHSLLRHPDTPDSYYKSLWRALLSERSWQGEIKNRNKSGDDYWLESTYSPLFDEFGRKIGYNEISQEITPRKLAEELSIKDQLTGLYNRFHIDKVMNIEVERARRYGNQLSLVLIDLDHFKAINDTYGHLEGDQVLQHVAEIMKLMTRTSDCVGRWGGEEFIVICPNTTADSAYALAEKVRATIAEQQLPKISHISASFGVTELRADDDAINVMIARADKALYTAKEQGRNQTVVL